MGEIERIDVSQQACVDGRRIDGHKVFIMAYWDGAAPATLVAGQPVILIPTCIDATSKLGGYKVNAVATAAYGQVIGVPTKTLTAAGWYEFQIRGLVKDAQVTLSASLDAGGESLEIINGGTTFIYDADARSAKTVAIALEPHTSGTTCDIWLLGEPGIVTIS